jgi:hypothetical protein
VNKEKQFEFAKIIASMAELYSVKLSADAIEWYWLALSEIDLPALKQAVIDHISSKDRGKWMPRPADILEIAVITPCSTCQRIGVVVVNGEQIFPWSLQREVEQGLKPEICPKCKGKNRVNTPGLPDVKFT